MSDITTTFYRQADDLEVHEADDGLIIFNRHSDRVHHLNPTAGVLFTLCEQPVTGEVLVASTLKLYGLDEKMADELHGTIDQLVQENVLTCADEA